MLHCLEARIKYATLICGDNKGVIQNCIIPYSFWKRSMLQLVITWLGKPPPKVFYTPLTLIQSIVLLIFWLNLYLFRGILLRCWHRTLDFFEHIYKKPWETRWLYIPQKNLLIVDLCNIMLFNFVCVTHLLALCWKLLAVWYYRL